MPHLFFIPLCSHFLPFSANLNDISVYYLPQSVLVCLFIGEYRVSEIDRLAREWFERFGSLVRVSGLLGRPDMVFLYDADEVARLFRNEDWAPVRPAMPSLHWWKHHLHKDFFSGDDAGLIAV